jgi:glucan phosphoethanolaminetransferase (alkaline phosphatase superfamily)
VERPLAKELVVGLAAGVGLVADVVLLAIAATRPESAALYGALVGTGLTLVIVLPTVAIAFVGPRLTPVSMAATVLGSWAVKMFAVILVLLLVRDMEALSTTWIGLALLVGAVSAMVVEATVLMRTRQPLDVMPPSDPGDRA